jgi:hypothetical protein
MNLPSAVILAASGLCLAGSAWADGPVTPLPEPTPSAGEPQVLRQVTEDDQVRIEELRVRGQTRRLTVQPKIRGIGPYEIAVPEPGRAPGDDPKAGQRIWWSINF